MTRVTVDWPDLGYTCVADTEDKTHSVAWKLYTLYAGVDSKGQPFRSWQRDGADTSPDMVDSPAEAEVYAHGYVKWDGCTNFMFPDCETGMMLHECERSGLVNLGVLLARVHDLCGEMMPSADYEPEPLPESYRVEEETA